LGEDVNLRAIDSDWDGNVVVGGDSGRVFVAQVSGDFEEGTPVPGEPAVVELGVDYPRILAVSLDQTLATSLDAGASWELVALPGIRAVAALPDDRAVAVGTSTYLLDGDGSAWKEVEDLAGLSLRDVAAWEDRIAAVGDGGTVAISEDGGITWKIDEHNTGDLVSVSRSFAALIAASEDGFVIRSGDGVTWTAPERVAESLVSVRAVGEQTAAATDGEDIWRRTGLGLWEWIGTSSDLVMFDDWGTGQIVGGEFVSIIVTDC
jgi:hypothetical protein